MWQVLTEFFNILVESSVYLLLGFALAGVMHVVLRRTPRFMDLLARKGGRSVTLAALLGAPLPLCSCGVVPVAMTLRKHGASKGATVSFLISCPETDVVSVLLTYALLGPIMAVFRPLAAIATAIIAGRVTNAVDRDNTSRDREGAEARNDPPDAVPSRCCHEQNEAESDVTTEYIAGKGPVWNALHYGFVQFFDDIIGSLLLGLALGGLIAVLLPRFGLENLAGGSSIIAMLVMLVVGVPMYVCAAASTPIAAGLVISGLSPGTALVFLLAGPATNLGSLLVLSKQLGRRVLVAYLASIAVVSVTMGLCLDAAFRNSVAAATVVHSTHDHGGRSLYKIAAAIALLVLALLSLWRRGRAHSDSQAARTPP
jgi:uncharacterized membrane protein YraQ (UPF0718 family)